MLYLSSFHEHSRDSVKLPLYCGQSPDSLPQTVVPMPDASNSKSHILSPSTPEYTLSHRSRSSVQYLLGSYGGTCLFTPCQTTPLRLAQVAASSCLASTQVASTIRSRTRHTTLSMDGLSHHHQQLRKIQGGLRMLARSSLSILGRLQSRASHNRQHLYIPW